MSIRVLAEEMAFSGHVNKTYERLCDDPDHRSVSDCPELLWLTDLWEDKILWAVDSEKERKTALWDFDVGLSV